MKKLSFALVGAAALAARGVRWQGDDAVGDNVADNHEAAADNLEAAADNATGAEAANLEAQADALEETGEANGRRDRRGRTSTRPTSTPCNPWSGTKGRRRKAAGPFLHGDPATSGA